MTVEYKGFTIHPEQFQSGNWMYTIKQDGQDYGSGFNAPSEEDAIEEAKQDIDFWLERPQ